MIAYDATYDPPAMIVSVTVAGVVHRRPRLERPALLDTGSDITAVPAAVKERLHLYPFGRLQLEDANAVTTTVFTYEVRLAWGEEAAREMEVVLTPYSFAILGRDWLRAYYVLLDGPGQRFQISRSPFPALDS